MVKLAAFRLTSRKMLTVGTNTSMKISSVISCRSRPKFHGPHLKPLECIHQRSSEGREKEVAKGRQPGQFLGSLVKSTALRYIAEFSLMTFWRRILVVVPFARAEI